MTQQLVVDLRKRSVAAVDNSAGLEPTEFDRPQDGQTVPRLGSVDLLRLAANADQFGYAVVGLTLRDRTMSPLPAATEERLTEEITEALRDGRADDAHRLLGGDRGPLAVISVHLVGEDDDEVYVGRLGLFESESANAMGKLITPAWKRLQLS